MSPTVSEPSWTVVVPVKRLAAAKSRLRGALPAVPHEELALALAADTVRAVRACPVVAGVVVVTDDPRVAAAVGPAGARVVADTPDTGLNAAFRHGASAVAGGWVAGLTADLPRWASRRSGRPGCRSRAGGRRRRWSVRRTGPPT
ncbi:NTP transferase domain-containing protein, partial [Micromonospora sp. NPDC049799]|uniref:NTP transferase domain-containing protein n=1 Tax=Micromonospora sp. NPDC049799 TaxID=3154741 RepID=UPI0033D4D9B8